ncbi:hypothetical protein MRS76_15435 [Rhizobiaceae bacterium n13]|uniref:hypothetical protein n=1 Tax=Ferirhizobium litorale TaxID=2927786 RepID=UPI0024B28C82|nr:hypothetical protein [Fererhizobium litorale]MDI7863349.1 hypothetical protein [Fererhizobium litorale]
MFNSLISAFQGANFFSRGFWLGNFLPVIIIAALHAVIAALVFPQYPLKRWLEEGNTLTMTSVAVAAMVAFAFAVAPLLSLFRGLLEGQYLPETFTDWMRVQRMLDWRRRKDALDKAMKQHQAFQDLNDEDIWTAIKQGNNLGTVNATGLIEVAEMAVNAFRKNVTRLKLSEADARAALIAVAEALKANAIAPKAGNEEDKKQAKRLKSIKDLFVDLLDEARNEARYRFARREREGRRIELLPTRVADARREVERYCEDTYGLDFNFIWPRIQIALAKGDSTVPQNVSDAEAQVNFSALMLVLALTVPGFWLPYLLVTMSHPWLFLFIGAITPVIVLFLFELVVRSHAVFGHAARVMVDKERLSVITDVMHLRAPATLADERLLWQRLRESNEHGNPADLVYKGTT